MSLGDLLTANGGQALSNPQASNTPWALAFGGGGGGGNPQTASNIYAALTREQWSQYVNTFVPIENQLIKYATDTTQPAQAMQQAATDVNSAYGAQAGATARQLTGLGVNLNPQEQASSDRSLGLSHALADVQAENTARDLTIQRQQSILGNPAPAVNTTTMPQGV